MTSEHARRSRKPASPASYFRSSPEIIRLAVAMNVPLSTPPSKCGRLAVRARDRHRPRNSEGLLEPVRGLRIPRCPISVNWRKLPAQLLPTATRSNNATLHTVAARSPRACVRLIDSDTRLETSPQSSDMCAPWLGSSYSTNLSGSCRNSPTADRRRFGRHCRTSLR